LRRFAARPVLATINPGPPRTLSKENPMNSVALIGRLTADPTTHAGEKHESATFRLAVPRPGSNGAAYRVCATYCGSCPQIQQ
jgi:hypothetical protein